MNDLNPILVNPIDPSEQTEELHAYHLSLDRLNAIMNPDGEDERWRISNVEKHLLRGRPDGSRPIYLKVQYADGDKAYHPLDVVRTHDPMIAARYAINKGIAGMRGWEWVSKYLETNPLCQHLTRIYKTTTEGTTKYKFGVEVP